jgi:hypothetical protein
VERQVKHEYASDWKQVGNLADGILRSVVEKRMKQAEFMAAEKGPFEAARNSPHAETRKQLVPPLSPLMTPPAHSSHGRL